MYSAQVAISIFNLLVLWSGPAVHTISVPADVVTLFVQLLVGFSAGPQWSSAPAARLTSEKKEGSTQRRA